MYLPKTKPVLVDVGPLNFLTLKGEGNPNDKHFEDYISALYSVSYAIKMNLKKEKHPLQGYQDYTVYPLEGVWDLNAEARKKYDGKINKDDLVFKLMIRQPDFVDEAYVKNQIELTKVKKPQVLLEKLQFETITEGSCVQMLHVGPYDNEPASFAQMEAYAKQEKRVRISKKHREIYLSDFRKTTPEKLKTVLRFKVGELIA